ncbi:MAG TPA: MarR family transcriptional regulator [Bacteroidia bacterium]|nr:MarR family transcriptional regulator [Bacteroidia bacterium]
MEIEKEIRQQTKFNSEYEKMAVNILYTAGWMDGINNRRLKPFGITTQQYNILRILRGQHPLPVTVNMLIERMLDKSSNASRLVEKLRLKDLVNRCTSDSDKRAVNVTITQKGLTLLKEIGNQQLSFEKTFHTLSKKEAEQLNTLLDKLRG